MALAFAFLPINAPCPRQKPTKSISDLAIADHRSTACALRHNRDQVRNRIIPDPLVATRNILLQSRLGPIAATKRDPEPSTQHGSGFWSLLPQLRLLSWAALSSGMGAARRA
jgi:hypothetical protein